MRLSQRCGESSQHWELGTTQNLRHQSCVHVMLNLNETIDLLAMADSVCWYGHVLRTGDDHVLRRALDFEVESQMKTGRLKRTWKKQVEEERRLV